MEITISCLFPILMPCLKKNIAKLDANGLPQNSVQQYHHIGDTSCLSNLFGVEDVKQQILKTNRRMNDDSNHIENACNITVKKTQKYEYIVDDDEFHILDNYKQKHLEQSITMNDDEEKEESMKMNADMDNNENWLNDEQESGGYKDDNVSEEEGSVQINDDENKQNVYDDSKLNEFCDDMINEIESTESDYDDEIDDDFNNIFSKSDLDEIEKETKYDLKCDLDEIGKQSQPQFAAHPYSDNAIFMRKRKRKKRTSITTKITTAKLKDSPHSTHSLKRWSGAYKSISILNKSSSSHLRSKSDKLLNEHLEIKAINDAQKNKANVTTHKFDKNKLLHTKKWTK